ncbi:hypothetical protein ACFE04_006772 [Oxalis oulophora]
MQRIDASASKIRHTARKRGPNKSRFNEDGSEKGGSCHQCRQTKSTGVIVACKFIRQANGPCPVKLCDTCLFNRYGEKKDEVLLLDDWKCPKCRGICNCSICRKNEGQQPTGILAPTARENGFASVADLLTFKSIGDCKKIVKEKENTKLDKEPNGDSKSKKSKKRERNGVVEKKRPKKQGAKGTDLTSVASPEEIGEAVQFLEFFVAFSKESNEWDYLVGVDLLTALVGFSIENNQLLIK